MGGSFFAAGRFSFTALLLSASVPSVSLDYWDYQTRLSLDVTPRDTVTIFAFGAHDFLGTTSNGTPTTWFNTTFHRIDLRYDCRFGGAEDRIRQAITLGADETGLDKGSYAYDHSIASRTEITKRATDADGPRVAAAELRPPPAGLHDGPDGGLQRSWQSSIGVEADLPWDVTGTLTLFRNAFFDMTDALGQGQACTTVVTTGPWVARGRRAASCRT